MYRPWLVKFEDGTAWAVCLSGKDEDILRRYNRVNLPGQNTARRPVESIALDCAVKDSHSAGYFSAAELAIVLD